MAEKKDGEYIDSPKKNKKNGETQTENLIYGNDVKTNDEKVEDKKEYQENNLNENK